MNRFRGDAEPAVGGSTQDRCFSLFFVCTLARAKAGGLGLLGLAWRRFSAPQIALLASKLFLDPHRSVDLFSPLSPLL